MRNSRFSVARCGAHSSRVAPREAQVGAKRIAHRVDEALGAARREAVLPPEVEHLHLAAVAVDARLDPADEAVAEEHRQHVPTPAPLGRRDEELPDVVELEQGSEQGPGPTPTDRTAAGMRRRAAAPAEPPAVRPPSARTKRFPRTPSTSTGTSSPSSTSSSRSAVLPGCLRPPRIRFGRTDAAEDVSAPPTPRRP